MVVASLLSAERNLAVLAHVRLGIGMDQGVINQTALCKITRKESDERVKHSDQ